MSSTTTATARGSTIDEAIAREELLIQIYEAELSELHRQQQEAAAEKDDVMRSADGEAVVQPTNNAVAIDDPMEWMIHQDNNTSESNETSSLLVSLQAHEDQELSSFSALHSSLQPVIGNFCFTVVRRLPNTETVVEAVDHVSMIRQKEEEQGVIVVAYSCWGYFHNNPAVKARIRINFAMMQPSSNSNTGNPSPRRAHYIQSFQCQIESPSPSNNDGASSSSSVRAEEDWTWLNGEIRVLSAVDTAGSAAASSPPNLTAWLDAVSSYLQFHAQRQACLLDLQKRYPHHLTVVVVGTEDQRSKSSSSSSKSKALLRINLRDESNEPNGGSSLSLVWGWIWKQGRDMLRLTSTGTAGLKQPDLDALVQVCGDRCGRALELLLQRIVVSPEKTHDEDKDHVTNKKKDKRDNKSKHVDADDEGNNQDDDSVSIAGDNDDDHQQQQAKSKDRVAKSGKRASLERDRQEKNPNHPNNRKQPSDGNQKAKG